MSDELERIRAAELRRLEEALAAKQAAAHRPEVTEADDATVDGIVAAAPLAVVDAYATWCGPCQVFAPTFARAAASHPGITFVKVDVDRSPAFAQRHQVQSIPTLLLFVRGRLVGRVAGALRPPDLEALLKRLEAEAGA